MQSMGRLQMISAEGNATSLQWTSEISLILVAPFLQLLSPPLDTPRGFTGPGVAALWLCSGFAQGTSEIPYWDTHGKIFEQLNTEDKRKLWFHRNLASEKTPVCDSSWQGMMFCPWSQWIFCHLLQRMQDQRAGLWVRVWSLSWSTGLWELYNDWCRIPLVDGPCPIADLCSHSSPLYCPSLLFLSLAVSHTIPRLDFCYVFCEPVHKSMGAVRASELSGLTWHQAGQEGCPPPPSMTELLMGDIWQAEHAVLMASPGSALLQWCATASVVLLYMHFLHFFICDCSEQKGCEMAFRWYLLTDQPIFQTWNWSFLISVFSFQAHPLD